MNKQLEYFWVVKLSEELNNVGKLEKKLKDFTNSGEINGIKVTMQPEVEKLEKAHSFSIVIN